MSPSCRRASIEMNGCCLPSGGIGAPLFSPVLTQPFRSSDASGYVSLWPWGYDPTNALFTQNKTLTWCLLRVGCCSKSFNRGRKLKRREVDKLSKATQQKPQRQGLDPGHLSLVHSARCILRVRQRWERVDSDLREATGRWSQQSEREISSPLAL